MPRAAAARGQVGAVGAVGAKALAGKVVRVAMAEEELTVEEELMAEWASRAGRASRAVCTVASRAAWVELVAPAVLVLAVEMAVVKAVVIAVMDYSAAMVAATTMEMRVRGSTADE